ncbi:MAG: hypothetical protein AAGF20_07760 [Pseudomonadota bacterium]
MLDWLKSLFQSAPRPNKIIDLEAYLSPAPGYTCTGDFECEAWDNGDWEIEIEVDHNGPAPDGPWSVQVNGIEITQMTPSARHETELTLRAGQNTLEFALKAGMSVELHGPNGLLLSGTLQKDR